jgi:hypothetical protein
MHGDERQDVVKASSILHLRISSLQKQLYTHGMFVVVGREHAKDTFQGARLAKCAHQIPAKNWVDLIQLEAHGNDPIPARQYDWGP